jgi:glycosyltransferase
MANSYTAKNNSNVLNYKDSFSSTQHVESIKTIGSPNEFSGILSIMIPTFNRVNLLAEAIQSAIIQNTSVPYCVVVVDNNTNPEISTQVNAIANGFGSRLVSVYKNQSNIGMYGNWNRCITLAQTEWLTILNDDDVLLPNFVEEAVSHIRGNSKFAMFAGGVKTLNQLVGIEANSLSGRLGSKIKDFLKHLFYPSQSIIEPFDYFLGNPHSGSLGIVFSRQEALRLGGFDVEYFPSADYLFWVRFALENRCLSYREIVGKYRVLENECLRPDVLDGWLQQGDEIRAALQPLVPLPSKELEKYAIRVKNEFLSNCIANYGDRYEVGRIIQKFSIGRFNNGLTKLLRLRLRLLKHFKDRYNYNQI